MNLLESRNRINTLMSIFVTQMRGATAMGQTDTNKVSETVLIPLFVEVYGYKNLRNLNTTERVNYPAIDLGDSVARVAIQITSTTNLNKVKDTLRKFGDSELYQEFDKLIIYMLTEKQQTYSKNACKAIVQGRFDFEPDRDILDYRDVLKEIIGFQIDKTRRIQDILEDNFGEVKTLLDTFSFSHFPKELVDQSINKEVDLLRKSRFFMEFDGIGYALTLARKLSKGDLYGGTDSVKSWALAWCARILSSRDKLDKAERYLKLAKSLGGDTKIADAFICSQKGDKNTALQVLAGVDSPNSRSAAFIIVGSQDGPQEAINWLKNTHSNVSDLDPDGKFILLKYQFELGQWEATRETINALSESDLEETPALHYMMAMSYLLSTVPAERRDVVLNHVPFDAATFPLASNAAAFDARRTAYSHFINAAEAVQKLNCPNVAVIPDGYALWLELRNPESYDKGRKRLEDKLGDLKSALHFVPLGLQFGIRLDLAVVEQEVERHIALYGGITRDAAVARFALARAQKTPEDVANYVDRHYNTLSKYLDTKAMRFLQIEMLSQSGRPESAKECLELLLDEGLSEAEESRLQTLIDKAEGKDTVEARKALFHQTDSLTDLIALVNELERRKKWDALCKYGETLFERTRSVQGAEGLANALHNANKPNRVIELLEANADILEQSTNLQVFYCWSLYYEGKLLSARSELAKMSADPENVIYRVLQVSIGIALGDWNSLSAYVADEYQAKENRSSHDLINAAQLALYLGSPYAKQLILAAVTKANDDASILAAAYFLASKAGWESDVEVAEWLHRAAELSGDDGPILKVTLNDVLDLKPEWDRQESETWQLLNRGEVPMFLAAKSLNKSLISLMLFPAWANLSESDPRRRNGIPAYSGKRQIAPFDAGGTVGIDATALLTLSFLNLLDKAIGAFDTVYVPHSTLAWLFEEKQKASFHQPSRIRDAHQVRHLLITNVLEEFTPSTPADGSLSAQVGYDLAQLIAEAENLTDDDIQRFVVRSSPIYKVTSLLEEEADLAGHASALSSCQSVVDKLHQKGQITANEVQNAHAYLQLREKPWPHQPEITNGAILYLDDLAVIYFLHLGILEKLHDAGFKLIASPSMKLEGNALIDYERISGKVNEAIERIRSVVSLHIESGKIKVGRRRILDELQDQPISEHPTVGVLALAEDCDAIIADDRFLNQHPHIKHNGAQAPLFSTLDLLDALASAGSITPDNRLGYRAKLRRAGYFFVPISEDELLYHLNTDIVADDKVNETAELKAIRENILRVRMSDWLQLPKEDVWLETTLRVFVSVLRSLWTVDADIPSVTVLSNWILDQLDIRGWAHSFGVEIGDNIVKTGRGGIIFMLLTSLSDAPQHIRDEYWSWVEDKVLAPIKEQYPDLYTWIVELKWRQISELVDMDLTEGEQYDE